MLFSRILPAEDRPSASSLRITRPVAMSPRTASALIQWKQRVGTSHAKYSLYSGAWLGVCCAMRGIPRRQSAATPVQEALSKGTCCFYYPQGGSALMCIKIWTFRPLCQCGAAQSVDISGKSGEWRVPFRAKRDLIGRHSAKATARTRQVVLPHHKAHWPASGTRGAGPDKN